MMQNVKAELEFEDLMGRPETEYYLKDLRQRLWALRLHYDEVIDDSVKVIKEIGEVASCISSPGHTKDTEQLKKIKQLINDFEALEAISLKTKVPGNMKGILEAFEQLNDSGFLESTRLQFQRTKDSFKGFDKCFKKYEETTELIKHASPNGVLECKDTENSAVLNTDLKDQNIGKDELAMNIQLNNRINQFEDNPELITECANSNADLENKDTNDTDLKGGINDESVGLKIQLKNKINQFNLASECKREPPTRYVSCCDSEISLEVYRSSQDRDGNTKSERKVETGYDGDNDESE